MSQFLKVTRRRDNEVIYLARSEFRGVESHLSGARVNAGVFGVIEVRETPQEILMQLDAVAREDRS